ncbi:hypothetical protein [Brevibacillus laterosporus]|nr:hypothetical protein [Brevibacillus laterosporus]
MDYVPANGYRAVLHQGEVRLPAQEYDSRSARVTMAGIRRKGPPY